MATPEEIEQMREILHGTGDLGPRVGAGLRGAVSASATPEIDYSQISLGEAFGRGFDPTSGTLYKSFGTNLLDIVRFFQPVEGVFKDRKGQRKPFRIIPNIQEASALLAEAGMTLTQAQGDFQAAEKMLEIGEISSQQFLEQIREPLTLDERPRLQAVIDFYQQNYDLGNNMAGLKEFIATDPVGFLSDASLILSFPAKGIALGGRSAKLTALASKLNANKALGKIGSGAKVANQAIAAERLEPIGLALRRAGKLVEGSPRVIGEIAPYGFGITTGAGHEALLQAYRNPTPELIAAMRGQVTQSGVLTEARDALEVFRQERATRYLDQLEKIQANNQQISFAPVQAELQKQLKRFNIRRDLYPDAPFKRSTVDTKGQGRTKRIIELIEDWGSQPEDFTPIGLDILKRRMDDIFMPTSNSRAFITPIRQALVKTLGDAIPEYKTMTREYAETTSVIKEIEATLGIGEKAKTDSAIKRLTSALNDNNEFRREMLNHLQTMSEGTDLAGEIAGLRLTSPLPLGGARVFTFVNIGGAIWNFDPTLLLALPIQSPRLMGEFMAGLGLASGQIEKIMQTKGGRFAKWISGNANARHIARLAGRTARTAGEAPGLTAEDLAVQQELEQSIRNRQ